MSEPESPDTDAPDYSGTPTLSASLKNRELLMDVARHLTDLESLVTNVVREVRPEQQGRRAAATARNVPFTVNAFYPGGSDDERTSPDGGSYLYTLEYERALENPRQHAVAARVLRALGLNPDEADVGENSWALGTHEAFRERLEEAFETLKREAEREGELVDRIYDNHRTFESCYDMQVGEGAYYSRVALTLERVETLLENILQEEHPELVGEVNLQNFNIEMGAVAPGDDASVESQDYQFRLTTYAPYTENDEVDAKLQSVQTRFLETLGFQEIESREFSLGTLDDIHERITQASQGTAGEMKESPDIPGRLRYPDPNGFRLGDADYLKHAASLVQRLEPLVERVMESEEIQQTLQNIKLPNDVPVKDMKIFLRAWEPEDGSVNSEPYLLTLDKPHYRHPQQWDGTQLLAYHVKEELDKALELSSETIHSRRLSSLNDLGGRIDRAENRGQSTQHSL